MAIKRIFSGNSKSDVAYEVEFTDDTKISLTKSSLTILDTKEKLDTDLTTKMGARKDKIFLHKNRSGTIAVATGAEPEVWPEDEIIK
jgi:hypothetical protein